MIVAGERGARIARACRSDEHLLRMLVEQKKDKVVNGHTFTDFKTLVEETFEKSGGLKVILLSHRFVYSAVYSV